MEARMLTNEQIKRIIADISWDDIRPVSQAEVEAIEALSPAPSETTLDAEFQVWFRGFRDGLIAAKTAPPDSGVNDE